MRANDRVRQLVTLVAIASGITVNVVFAAAVPSPPSAARDLPLDAAPYAFAIWGLVFAGQAAYAVYQSLPSQRARTLHRSVGRWAAINGIAQVLWVVAVAQRQHALGWLLIVVMLGALVAIEVATGARRHGLSPADRWLVRAPFAVNLGWVSAALVLSTASVSEGVLGWSGEPLGPVVWGVVVVIALAALALVMLLRRDNVLFAATAAWALLALALGSDARAIVVTAFVATAVVTAATLAALARSLPRRASTRARGA